MPRSTRRCDQSSLACLLLVRFWVFCKVIKLLGGYPFPTPLSNFMKRILFPAPTLQPLPPRLSGRRTSVPFISLDLLFNPLSRPLLMWSNLFSAAGAPPSNASSNPNSFTISRGVSPSRAVTYMAPSLYPVAEPAETALAGSMRTVPSYNLEDWKRPFNAPPVEALFLRTKSLAEMPSRAATVAGVSLGMIVL